MAMFRPRLWKWTGAALAASVAYSSYSAWRADAAYQEKLSKLKALGVYTRVEDLPNYGTDPKFEAAVAELTRVRDWQNLSRQIASINGTDGADRARRARAALVGVVPAAILAADSESVGYAEPDYDTPDPRVQEISALLSILAGEAELAALDGDSARSLRAMKALQRLSRVAARGTGYLPYLLANNGLHKHYAAAETFVREFARDPDDLKQFKLYMEGCPDGIDFRESFNTQFAVAQDWLGVMSISANMRMNAQTNGTQYSFLEKAKGFAQDSSFVKTRSRHELASKWIRAAEAMKGKPADYRLYAELRKHDIWHDDTLVGEVVEQCNFIPPSSRVALQLEQIAMKRVLLASTEVLLELWEKGKLPVALAQRADHIDPLNGKPLIYKNSGSGFLLYSVGGNTTDDGGRRSGAKGQDIVFEFQR